MKRYIQFLSIVLSAAALVACNEKETLVDVAGGSEIRFSASIGNFQVKATDVAFEKGDVIGLFADDPVSATNASLTWDGNALVPDTPLTWGVNQDVNQSVPFYAYYPYAAGMSKKFTFTVGADQSSEAVFKAADLMLASTSAAPRDEAVRLNFSHKMARVVFFAESHIAGTEVADVTVSGLALSADVDITVPSITASGQASTVKAAPVAGPDGNKGWAVIVPGQKANALEVAVTLSDGSVYKLPAVAVNLYEGRSYTANIIIDETLNEPVFSATVTDWLDSWLYLGKEYDPGVQEHMWYLDVGSLYPFEKQEDGIYHLIYYNGNNYGQFRIVKDNYAEVWGSLLPGSEKTVSPRMPEVVIPLAPNGCIYLGSQSGIFDLYLDVNAKTLTLKHLDHDWYSLGTGSFVEGIISDVFGLPHEDIEVEFLADRNVSTVYRVVNPYENWTYRSLFNYSDGAYIDLHVKSDNTVWIPYSYTGLSYSRYGAFYIFSLVDETGFGDNEYASYGKYYPEDGFFQFWNYISLDLTDYGRIMTNAKGMFSFTLPGYERPVHYYDFSDSYTDNWINEDGQRYFRTAVTVGMDVALVKYGVYAGSLSREEALGMNRDGLCYTEVKPNGNVLEFYPDDTVYLDVPVPQTGTYTIVWYLENAAGEQVLGTYSHYWVVYDGDDVPEATAAITAAPAQPMPDIQVNAHVDFTDPADLYLLAVPEKDWAAWGIGNDDAWDFVMSNGDKKNIYYVNSKTGADYVIGNLAPETDYRVFVAGTNKFGNTAWAQTRVTTEPEPSFTSIGTGRYTDNFLFNMSLIEEGYTSDVEILKAAATPNRYRVVAPYEAFWNKYANKVPYSGFHAANIDFYVEDGALFYDPYYTGYLEEGYGDVRYWCVNPFSGTHLDYNREIQEGVFNIAPYAKIEGSNYYYYYIDVVGEIYIELPGYTYDRGTQSAGAPRRAPGKGVLVEAPVASGNTVLTENRPFTRHMLGTGTARVTRIQPALSEISAEPLK